MHMMKTCAELQVVQTIVRSLAKREAANHAVLVAVVIIHAMILAPEEASIHLEAEAASQGDVTDPAALLGLVVLRTGKR